MSIASLCRALDIPSVPGVQGQSSNHQIPPWSPLHCIGLLRFTPGMPSRWSTTTFISMQSETAGNIQQVRDDRWWVSISGQWPFITMVLINGYWPEMLTVFLSRLILLDLLHISIILCFFLPIACKCNGLLFLWIESPTLFIWKGKCRCLYFIYLKII